MDLVNEPTDFKCGIKTAQEIRNASETIQSDIKILSQAGMQHYDIIQLSPEKRREIVFKLNIEQDHLIGVKKKLTMD